MKRLLVLSCSQRKCSEPSPLPALERYDGPAFRVLRRYLRMTRDKSLAIYILSAEFGLMSANRKIPLYDRRLTAARAQELQAQVTRLVNQVIRRYKPIKVLICAGKMYWRALENISQSPPGASVAPGGQGEKLARLKAWLYGR